MPKAKAKAALSGLGTLFEDPGVQGLLSTLGGQTDALPVSSELSLGFGGTPEDNRAFREEVASRDVAQAEINRRREEHNLEKKRLANQTRATDAQIAASEHQIAMNDVSDSEAAAAAITAREDEQEFREGLEGIRFDNEVEFRKGEFERQDKVRSRVTTPGTPEYELHQQDLKLGEAQIGESRASARLRVAQANKAVKEKEAIEYEMEMASRADNYTGPTVESGAIFDKAMTERMKQYEYAPGGMPVYTPEEVNKAQVAMILRGIVDKRITYHDYVSIIKKDPEGVKLLEVLQGRDAAISQSLKEGTDDAVKAWTAGNQGQRFRAMVDDAASGVVNGIKPSRPGWPATLLPKDETKADANGRRPNAPAGTEATEPESAVVNAEGDVLVTGSKAEASDESEVNKEVIVNDVSKSSELPEILKPYEEAINVEIATYRHALGEEGARKRAIADALERFKNDPNLFESVLREKPKPAGWGNWSFEKRLNWSIYGDGRWQ